jgi:hypothetical protein
MGQCRNIAAGPGETADDQKILVPADQGRHCYSPVENEPARVSCRAFSAGWHHPLL